MRRIHRFAERATEGVIYGMIVFSPWAFGTTQPWSIWTMNVLGYVLGLLAVTRLVIGKGVGPGKVLTGRRSPTSAQSDENSSASRQDAGAPGGFGDPRSVAPAGGGGMWVAGLGVLTVLILAYCLVAAWNARARYDDATDTFIYFDSFVKWLPHSYDATRSWNAFWNYLALACGFWCVYFWLSSDPTLGPTREAPADDVEWEEPEEERTRRHRPPPRRLTRLMIVMAVNGALLALVGLVQRADGGAKLLWLVETAENQSADAQFGPYAYRSNAAQYLNILWPVLVGFWWWSEHSARREDRRSIRLLPPIAMLIAACPLISLSRAGALVAILEVLMVAGVIVLAASRRRRTVTMTATGVVLAVIAVAAYTNGSQLVERFRLSGQDQLQGRRETYEVGWRISHDFPIYGTGPGTFEPIFQLYRNSLADNWPAQLHNDWLETLITFGTVGACLIWLALLWVLVRGFVGSGSAPAWPFRATLWIGLGGCLLHARVDFPFQIYSILHLFLVVCAMLLTNAVPKKLTS